MTRFTVPGTLAGAGKMTAATAFHGDVVQVGVPSREQSLHERHIHQYAKPVAAAGRNHAVFRCPEQQIVSELVGNGVSGAHPPLQVFRAKV